MMNLYKKLRTLGTVAVLAMMTITAWAGEGHDHGEAPVLAKHPYQLVAQLNHGFLLCQRILNWLAL